MLRLWFEWADSTIGNPLAIAEEHFTTFPEPEILLSVAESLLQHRFSFNDQPVWELWHSTEGISKAFALLLDKYHPEADPDPIIEALGMDQVQRLLEKANGIPPIDTTEIERQFFTNLGFLPEQEQTAIQTMDWAEFDASLFQNLHLTPAQIDDLTPVEITVLCKGEQEERSLGEFADLAKLYLKLSPQQILELTKLKHRG